MVREIEWATFERDRYKIKSRESLDLIETELREFDGFIDIGHSDLTVSFEKGTNTANLPEWMHQHLKWLDDENVEHPISVNVQFCMSVYKCPFWLYLKTLENQLKKTGNIPHEISSIIMGCERVCSIYFIA